MKKLTPIHIPLVNPNEPEALLASLEAQEGQSVSKGDVIALVETTKSTAEVLTEADGYLVGLMVQEGDSLRAGDVLAYIGDSPSAHDPALPPWTDGAHDQPETPPDLGDLRITSPARELALEMGIDLADLPLGPLITQQMLREQFAKIPSPTKRPESSDDMRILIYGAGGHGRSLAALIRKSGLFEVQGFLDDGLPIGDEILGLKILGDHESLPSLRLEGIQYCVNGVGGIGNLQSRLNVYTWLRKAGFFCPTVIHPTAFLEESASLGDGVQVFPFAYVGTEVQVGYGCIINTGAIVSHNCILEPYVNLSPGATLAGGVIVGEEALIGMRATVNLYVKVGKRARIGNGATVKDDVPDGGVVPAGTIWPPR